MANGEERASGPDRFEVGVALAAVALGLVVLAGSFFIDLGAGYDRIGPRFFPHIVGLGLVVSGGLLVWFAVERGDSARSRRRERQRAPLVTLSLALASSVLLLERAGFILTSTLLFWLVARAFESRRPCRDAVVGLALSVAAYVAFTRGLGLSLPRGLL